MQGPPRTPAVSVVIRAKNEANSIGRVLDLLRTQEIGDRAVELIVVDSGSEDGTPAIARDHGARVVEIPAESFTFGGALNTGCAAASAPVMLALSAHAFPPDTRWLGRMLDCFDDPKVACCYGVDNTPDDEVLRERVVQDEEHARRHWHWGYGNPAGAFRAELWRERPFREDMPGTEDREWAWHWLQQGWVAVIDPALRVEHDHSHDPLLDLFRRYKREAAGYTMYLDDLPPYGLRDLARDWWRGNPKWPSRLRALVSPKRAAYLLGNYAGRRRSKASASRALARRSA